MKIFIINNKIELNYQKLFLTKFPQKYLQRKTYNPFPLIIV